MRAYHVWFSTKKRKGALVDEIGGFVRASLREVAHNRRIRLEELETALDHVHLLLLLNDGQSLSTVMHDLKGVTARQVFLRFPELRIDMAANSFWQKGFGYRQVPPEQIETVRDYIRTQMDRPLRHE